MVQQVWLEVSGDQTHYTTLCNKSKYYNLSKPAAKI